jgi:hypothetical protein
MSYFKLPDCDSIVIFNNEDEVKRFLLRIDWDDCEDATYLGVVIALDEDDDNVSDDSYLEFDDVNGHTILKPDMLKLNEDVWDFKNGPIAMYVNFSDNYDRLGSFVVKQVVIRQLNECNVDKIIELLEA